MKPGFEEIVKKYIKLVYFFARKWARAEDVDDMVQNTFLKAARSYDTFHFQSEGQLKSWLLTICRNTIIDSSRSQQVIKLSTEEIEMIPDEGDQALQTAVAREDEQSVLAVLENLDKVDQLIVKLRIYEEMEFEEIGQVFTISQAAAKMRFYRAIEKLKKSL